MSDWNGGSKSNRIKKKKQKKKNKLFCKLLLNKTIIEHVNVHEKRCETFQSTQSFCIKFCEFDKRGKFYPKKLRLHRFLFFSFFFAFCFCHQWPDFHFVYVRKPNKLITKSTENAYYGRKLQKLHSTISWIKVGNRLNYFLEKFLFDFEKGHKWIFVCLLLSIEETFILPKRI